MSDNKDIRPFLPPVGERLTFPSPLRPSRPVERIPNGARVTVDLSPQLGLVLPGVVEGVTYVPGEFLYLINIGLDGMRLTNVPAGRIHREEEGA